MNKISIAVGALCAFLVAGCEGGTGTSQPGHTAPSTTTLEVRVSDITGAPIVGADVTVIVGETELAAATGASGVAEFPGLPRGETSIRIDAAGFESITATVTLGGGSNLWDLTLEAAGAWAAGRAVVLGTRMLEREADGSAMTFSVDLAVIDADSEALETLTSADFSVLTIDCGWGGPRDCASDAAGSATGAGGNFSSDGGVLSFALQPAGVRREYLVSVLAERSTSVYDWEEKVPALQSFFTGLAGGDAAGLASIQVEQGVTTLTPLGPFTGDGSSYIDAIDRLAVQAGDPPLMFDSVLESIRLAAVAAAGDFPGTEPTVLVLAAQELAIAEIDAATVLARQLGLRISTIGRETFGYPELAVRTGGFVAEYSDDRQLGMLFGAADRLLAGTVPFYRMQFRISGAAGTFVSGGNAKVRMRIEVPAEFPSNGVYTKLDVAIP